MDNQTYTLTCKVGRFEFEVGTPFAHAKLIRDSVMGQILNPHEKIKPIASEKDVHKFVERLDDSISGIPFKVELKDEYGGESDLAERFEKAANGVQQLNNGFKILREALLSDSTKGFLAAMHQIDEANYRAIREMKLTSVGEERPR